MIVCTAAGQTCLDGSLSDIIVCLSTMIIRSKMAKCLERDAVLDGIRKWPLFIMLGGLVPLFGALLAFEGT